MIKAAIFDLDGTLVDSNDLHAEAWQETFRHFGREIAYQELRQQIRKDGDQYLPVFLSERELKEIGPEVERYRGDLFKKKYLARVRPFPKVKELFERVRHDGRRIALASSGNEDEVEHYVKLAALGGLFDVLTTKSNVEHSKPSPDIDLRLGSARLQRAGFGVPPKRTSHAHALTREPFKPYEKIRDSGRRSESPTRYKRALPRLSVEISK